MAGPIAASEADYRYLELWNLGPRKQDYRLDDPRTGEYESLSMFLHIGGRNDDKEPPSFCTSTS